MKRKWRATDMPELAKWGLTYGELRAFYSASKLTGLEVYQIYPNLSPDAARDLVAKINAITEADWKVLQSKLASDLQSDIPKSRWLTQFANRLSLAMHEIRSGPRILSPPGSFLLAIADCLCSKKTRARIADEVIATMQYEYFKALNEGRWLKAKLIRERGFYEFFKALGLDKILKTIVDVWRAVGM